MKIKTKIITAVIILITAAGQGFTEINSVNSDIVDSDTLTSKIMCGYQGWFTAAGDDNPFNLWIHWGKNHANPNGSNLIIDMYPDMTEFDADELFGTAMTLNGASAKLYSGRTYKTVNRHVKWMKEYDIDGVFAQLFIQIFNDPAYLNHMKAVRQNLLTSCEEYGRVMATMYDISGANESDFWEKMSNDWVSLVDSGFTANPRYIKQNGKPVVGIWGFGFKDGVHPPTDPAVALSIINWFKKDAPEKYRATVFGGIPGYWRTLNNDSRTEAGWTNVYHAFDIISPWTVGRYNNNSGADNWKSSRISPDLAEVNPLGIGYSTVIWPGFSWHNLTGGTENAIPRNGGNFIWRQAYNAVDAGANMIYVAMFDEVDEATAIYKIAPTSAETPDQGYWLALDADGYSLPSDWYLRLTYDIEKMLRDNTPSSVIPPQPGPQVDITEPINNVTGSSTNSPASEAPQNVIDNNIYTKYLNFDKENSGFTITPSVMPSIITGIVLTTANDTPERDPASITIRGTIDSLTYFDVVTDMTTTLPSERFQRTFFEISNTNVYETYQIIFPTLKDSGSANSMQIAEIQLLGEKITPPSATITNEYYWSSVNDLPGLPIQPTPNDLAQDSGTENSIVKGGMHSGGFNFSALFDSDAIGSYGPGNAAAIFIDEISPENDTVIHCDFDVAQTISEIHVFTQWGDRRLFSWFEVWTSTTGTNSNDYSYLGTATFGNNGDEWAQYANSNCVARLYDYDDGILAANVKSVMLIQKNCGYDTIKQIPGSVTNSIAPIDSCACKEIDIVGIPEPGIGIWIVALLVPLLRGAL